MSDEQRSGHGWQQRPRIGVLVPASNTVVESDFNLAFHGIASVHTARMYLAEPITPDGETAMLDHHLEPAVRDLACVAPDVAVFGCTSAAPLRGQAYQAELQSRMSEELGCRVLTILEAMRGQLRSRGLERLALLTPYEDPLTEVIAEDLTAHGFDVRVATGMQISSNLAVGRVAPEAIVQAAVDATRGVPDLDAMAIACTNLRAFEARDAIAAQIGLPVITANSAVIDEAADVLGVTPQRPGGPVPQEVGR